MEKVVVDLWIASKMEKNRLESKTYVKCSGQISGLEDFISEISKKVVKYHWAYFYLNERLSLKNGYRS